MKIFKKIVLILSILPISLPAFAMEQNDANQGWFSSLWNTIKEHPLATASIAGATVLGLYLYKNKVANDLGEQLYTAIYEKDVKKVAELLYQGAPINWKKYCNSRWEEMCHHNGIRPLHMAVEIGSEEIVKLLLERGASINATDNEGETPLHLAARTGGANIVKLLLMHGANVNARDENGETAMHKAGSNESHIECIKILVENGADINCKNTKGYTPLHECVLFSRKTTTKELLKNGAEIDYLSVLFAVPKLTQNRAIIFSGKVEMLRILIEHGADYGHAIAKVLEPMLRQPAANVDIEQCANIINHLLIEGCQIYNKENSDLTGECRRRLESIIESLNDKLPDLAIRRLISFMQEDICDIESLNLILQDTSIENVVATFPINWLKDISKNLPDIKKKRFLDKIIDPIVELRFAKLHDLINQPLLKDIDTTLLDPRIIACFNVQRLHDTITKQTINYFISS